MIKEAKFKRVIKRYFENLTGKRAARIKELAMKRIEAADSQLAGMAGQMAAKPTLKYSPAQEETIKRLLRSAVRADRSILAADAVRKRTRFGTAAAIGVPTVSTLAYKRKKRKDGK